MQSNNTHKVCWVTETLLHVAAWIGIISEGIIQVHLHMNSDLSPTLILNFPTVTVPQWAAHKDKKGRWGFLSFLGVWTTFLKGKQKKQRNRRRQWRASESFWEDAVFADSKRERGSSWQILCCPHTLSKCDALPRWLVWQCRLDWYKRSLDWRQKATAIKNAKTFKNVIKTKVLFHNFMLLSCSLSYPFPKASGLQ